MQSSFKQRYSKSCIEGCSAKTEILIKEMGREVNGKEFEIYNYVSLCLMDIVIETTMGLSSNLQMQKDLRYANAMKTVFEIIFNRIFKVWLHPDIIFYNTKIGRSMTESIKSLHKITNNIVRRKKETMNTNETRQGKNDFQGFLDSIMKLQYEQDKFTDDELREEVEVILAAGADTSTQIICLVMLLLACHPEIQDKVYEELYEIYGSDSPRSTPVSPDDLSRMEYMERVIKETLRLFPDGAMASCRVIDDLEMGNYTLIKGTTIFLGVIHMHRSEKYWKEPLTFDPDRFLPEECAKRHPFVYVPFSAGPRNCIGINYAMTVMKTVLATILREFVVKKDKHVSVEDIRIRIKISLTIVDPILVRIEKRLPKTTTVSN